MKIADFRKKSAADLVKEIAKTRDAIAKTEMEKYSSDDKNYKKQRNQRRDLAKMLTALKETTQTTAPETADDKKKEDK